MNIFLSCSAWLQINDVLQEYTAATALLSSLLSSSSNSTVRSALARIHLLSGNLGAAEEHVTIVEADPLAEEALKRINAVLLSSAKGEWARVESQAQSLLGAESEKEVDTGADVVVKSGADRMRARS